MIAGDVQTLPTMSRTRLPVSARNDALGAYFREANKHPILSADEEYMLAKQWQVHGDADAARRLVTSHLRLVAKIALGYRGYGLPLEDVVSEGNVGLMQAVRRFDPERGTRLSTYAMWWIRAAIQEYVLRSWSLVKLGTTAAQKKLFFNLRKLKNQIRAVDDGDLPPEAVKQIASDLGVSEDDVVMMNRRLGGLDQSLNAPVQVTAEAEWLDRLVDPEPDPETVVAEVQEIEKRRELLEEALESLKQRERHIFTERCLRDYPLTLEALSKVYGISRERVRQIELRSFEKIQSKMLSSAIAAGIIDRDKLLAKAEKRGSRRGD